MSRLRSIAVTLLFFVMIVQPAAAQTDVLRHVWQVFIEHNIDDSGTDRLVFFDPLTGDENTAEVSGERYVLFGRSVLFYDSSRRRVMLASPDGKTQPHSFMQPESSGQRIDWLIADDGLTLAWTLTEGNRDSLTTITMVANADGTNVREVLTDGPRDGIRALPVAFNPEYTILYMDYQPDGLSDFTPFPQYAGLFALDLESGETEFLAGEPGCFCGAGFQGDTFLRLAVTSDLAGFDLHVHNLPAEVESTISAMRLLNYTQAGDFLFSPDGSYAVYALAQISDFLTAQQAVEIVFMLVDLDTMTQRSLNEPITTFVQPVGWTEDDSAIILTSPQEDGTWKLTVSDGKFSKVAEATYLGTLYPPG